MAFKPSRRNGKTPDSPEPTLPVEFREREGRVSIGVDIDPPPSRSDRVESQGRPMMAVGIELEGRAPEWKPAEVSREQIANRAYDIWVRNGRPEGTADRDWHQAETELQGEPAMPAPLDRPGVSAATGGGRPATGRIPAGTVRLNGNVRHVTRSEWLGAPRVDEAGRIERTAEIPEDVYQQIERAIARGSVEGMIFLDNQRRVDWFLDR